MPQERKIWNISAQMKTILRRIRQNPLAPLECEELKMVKHLLKESAHRSRLRTEAARLLKAGPHQESPSP